MSETEIEPSTKATRRRRMQSLVREDVIDAVVDLVTSEGVAHLTMEKVARRAEVAKGTLYLHFDNKDRLIRQTIDAVLEPLVADVLAALGSDLSADRKLRTMAELNVAYFDRHRRFFRLFLFERYLAQTQAQRQSESHYRKVHEAVARTIRAGTALGRFRAVDPDPVALAWLESMTAFVVRRLVSDAPGPIDDDVELLTGLFLDGLSAG